MKVLNLINQWHLFQCNSTNSAERQCWGDGPWQLPLHENWWVTKGRAAPSKSGLSRTLRDRLALCEHGRTPWSTVSGCSGQCLIATVPQPVRLLIHWKGDGPRVAWFLQYELNPVPFLFHSDRLLSLWCLTARHASPVFSLLMATSWD